MKPLVSVIVPLYNYSQYIEECIDSVVKQSFQDFELLVVDDCSKDAGADIAEECINAYGINGRVIRLERNAGYSIAKNIAIKRAVGKYITTLDADDIFAHDSLKVRIGHLVKTPELDFIHGRTLRWRGGSDTYGFNKKTYCHAQGRMYKRDLHKEFGLYHPMRSMSDKEFVYRLGIHPNSPLPKIVKEFKINDTVAWYRKHNKQMHKTRRDNKKYNHKIKKDFKRRIKQLKKEGITKYNTEFLDA